MVLKASFAHLNNEEPEMYLSMESAVKDMLFFSFEEEEEAEDFFDELINDDFLGTSD